VWFPLIKNWQRPTLPPVTAVPSALIGLTSLFGMERGGLYRYNHHIIFVISSDNWPSASLIRVSIKPTLTPTGNECHNILVTNEGDLNVITCFRNRFTRVKNTSLLDLLKVYG
jgi:hypothetical protein